MNRLRVLRAEKGVSQQTVADYLEITRQAYSNYENGNRNPDNETLLKLAEYFEVSVDCILRGAEKAPTPEGERQIGFDDFTYAMQNEAKDLPQEKKDMLLQMARFMKAEMEKDEQ